ncbi:MAG TPA: ArsA-related P-loop ATPase [Myxococcales bacterium]|jgi:anion-transporting  ArsA/GET3 family ATPase
MSEQDLASLVDKAPLVVCLGPGGVGKTTLSAVLALRQAAVGKRSLVLTIDPARRLADALGLAGLTNDAVEVTSFQKMHPGGSLSALMLDPTATFDHLVAMLVSDPARREALFANRYYQHMSRSLAGTLEYMAVERLHDLTHSKKFDAIVLDTPPTTNALDFLEAPEKIAVFFSERVVKWLMPVAKRKESWTSRIFSRAGSVALGLMSKVAGDEFVNDTAGFFGAFADLLGSFRARGLEVGKLLRDPQTAFLIVCAPDLTRLAEAQEIDRRLAGAGCKVHGFVVNRVDEAFLPLAGELERTIERATELMGGEPERERVRGFMERLEKLRQDHESNAAVHAKVVESLRAYAAPRPVFSAPRIPAGQSPRASLLALYVGLFAGAPVPESPEVTAS